MNSRSVQGSWYQCDWEATYTGKVVLAGKALDAIRVFGQGAGSILVSMRVDIGDRCSGDGVDEEVDRGGDEERAVEHCCLKRD